jgi:dTMP kinase
MRKGVFITFEGPEGSGKTTHIELLAAYLRAKGKRVLVTREPGGTALAAGIRKLLLDGQEDLSPMSELFLYEADRAQHVYETLAPALQKGTIVLCDRYTDSTLAYQGFGRGLDRNTIKTLNTFAAGGLQPTLTILLDVPAERGLMQAKRKKNHHDRLERAGLAFHRRVREGFLRMAKNEQKRFRVIPQQNTIEATQTLIQNAIHTFLKS